ncbi:MAG: chemotaxis protein CheW [Spirochaetes bacterium]|nr:chemotaxis protein CheW [Spirochaetota bacterium]MBU1079609.1 chemotaxis protein CheW [Spirochaetota bacterium]
MGASKAEAGRYLCFSLGRKAYAVPVVRVEVVLETPVMTRVPNSQPHLRGVINYRGSVVPVIDPLVRFGEDRVEMDSSPAVIVLQLSYEGENLVVGMLAEEVSEVLDIDEGALEAVPAMGTMKNGGFVSGVAKVGDEFIVLLDVDAAFSRDAVAEARAGR